jgi:hypothetical protein
MTVGKKSILFLKDKFNKVLPAIRAQGLQYPDIHTIPDVNFGYWIL